MILDGSSVRGLIVFPAQVVLGVGIVGQGLIFDTETGPGLGPVGVGSSSAVDAELAGFTPAILLG